MRSTEWWDPAQYLVYEGQRLRPYLELIARIGATDPRRIVDLGCGPGNATKLLLARWPAAQVLGIDNSDAMIEQAESLTVPGSLTFQHADVRNFSEPRSVDVLVSNSTLQWIPGHLGLFANLVGSLAHGGWFAFQMPRMEGQPSLVTLAELVNSRRWASKLSELAHGIETESAERYLGTLLALGCDVDVWETTYYQILPGDDPVLEWVKGTRLRPYLSRLDEEDRAEFLEAYAALLREAYPEGPLGTVFPFRRVFAVAQAPG